MFVMRFFEFLAERPVQIKDLFRLGKRNPSSNSSTRPRPVLIKLCAIWDRKVLLMHKKNLQQFRVKGLFLRADVPPEHRLRQGTKSKAKANPQPAIQQSSSSVEPVTDAGVKPSEKSDPSQPSPPVSQSTQSSSVPFTSLHTHFSPCLVSRGQHCRSSSLDSPHSSSSTIVEGYTSS